MGMPCHLLVPRRPGCPHVLFTTIMHSRRNQTINERTTMPPDPTPITEAELKSIEDTCYKRLSLGYQSNLSIHRERLLLLLAAARENAGLREEVKWLKEKRSGGFDNIDDLTIERNLQLIRAFRCSF